MQNHATIWNGHDWETLELEVALARVADGTGQMVDVNVGAQDLWTPEEFMQQRAMRAAKAAPKPKPESETDSEAQKPALKRGEYRTVDMKAKKP